MQAIALYRKYRPEKFEDVLGQGHIVNVLKQAVKLGRISHAYLFAGPRGCGKTSVARILAREAGCSDADLMEIDAASSRGIDEIRALREGVRYSPLQGKVKVYIIDEVHMLTKEAFNALLKTLEEPPAHAIFILATTEMEKILDTIVSRCQSFTFKKIPENVLKDSLVKIAKKEGFEIEDESAGLVAMLAEGSFRDSQSLLDQVLSLGDKDKNAKISGEEVRNLLSVPARDLVEEFVSALVEKDPKKGLNVIQKVIDQNTDTKIFLKLVLRCVRFMLMISIDESLKKNILEMVGEDEFKFIESKKKAVSDSEFGRIIKILLDHYDTRSRSYLPQLPLELALIKITS